MRAKMNITKEKTEESEKFFRNENFVHFISMLAPSRPGVQLCITRLEHEHYQPGTEMNKDFIMRIINWKETEIGDIRK